MRLLVLACVLLVASAAAAQDAPPGPWVLDLRGATSALSNDGAFFPGLPTGTLVPSRGLGFEAGAHVYVATLGPARVGLGASYLLVRGAADDVESRFGALAPQVSFNFGTADGWSYLSAGWGRAWVRTSVDGLERDSGGIPAINVGGGARWFVAARAAVGFDVRFHRLSPTDAAPATLLASVSVGVSVR